MPHTKTLVFLLALLAVTSAVSHDPESRIVKTSQGPVRGYNTDGIYHFYGIPYATAPTGKRKFTAPLPGPAWMNPFEATNKKIICPQGKTRWFDFSNHDMREDCLIANVHVPDTNNISLPVVVYVHGGAYQIGYGQDHPPTPLVLTKKLIAVTFNHRLGVHGFLCLGTENAPGNAGMKDQVALLRWVKENIANFGGNPDEVTIAGYSAGSSSVDLLMLSEMTEGLFNKVIPESGASVGVWSVQLDPVQNAKDFAKQLNFTDVHDVKRLDEFYSNLSYDAMTSDTFLERPDSTFVFSPCVERDTGVEKFLVDAPVSIITKGKYRKIPMLYGFANMEGLFRASEFEYWKDKMNERFSDFLPADLKFKHNEEKERVAKMIKYFYFGNQTISEENVQGFIDYFSDIIFAYPHLRSVQLQVKAGSTSIYLYEYSFFTPYPKKFGVPDFMENLRGAGHCAQSYAVLENKNDIKHGTDSEEYKKMRKIMVTIWVNFITTGTPVPQGSDLPPWPPVGANRSPHMDLGEEIQMKGPLLEKRAHFWDDIYELYYRSPLAPSTTKERSEL